MPMRIVLETKPNGEGFSGLDGLSFADQSRVFLSPSARERVCALIGNELKSPV